MVDKRLRNVLLIPLIIVFTIIGVGYFLSFMKGRVVRMEALDRPLTLNAPLYNYLDYYVHTGIPLRPLNITYRFYINGNLVRHIRLSGNDTYVVYLSLEDILSVRLDIKNLEDREVIAFPYIDAYDYVDDYLWRGIDIYQFTWGINMPSVPNFIDILGRPTLIKVSPHGNATAYLSIKINSDVEPGNYPLSICIFQLYYDNNAYYAELGLKSKIVIVIQD